MGFPADDLTTVHLDGTGDDPSQARAELLAAIQKIQAIIASYDVASGICPLDASGYLPAGNVNGTAMTALLNVATTALKGLMSAADKTKLDGLSNYNLPVATTGVLGGIKVGTRLTITDGVLAATLQLNTHAVGSYVVSDLFSASDLSAHDYTEKREWKVSRGTAVRVRVGYISSDAATTGYLRVFKNDSLADTLLGTSTAWTYLNVDLDITANDTIQLQTRVVGGGTVSFFAVVMTNFPVDAGSLYTHLD